ncbi:hypothetical protein D918_02839 [Trichuris suis]|nr:hypothetical protein D918_02839 [Trichuris suis]
MYVDIAARDLARNLLPWMFLVIFLSAIGCTTYYYYHTVPASASEHVELIEYNLISPLLLYKLPTPLISHSASSTGSSSEDNRNLSERDTSRNHSDYL